MMKTPKPRHTPFLLLFALALVGCGKNVANVDGKGFGGTNLVLSALNSARDRLVLSIGKLQGSGAANPCLGSYSGGEGEVSALVALVSGDPAKQSALTNDWFSASPLQAWKNALYRIEFEVVQEGPDVRVEGDKVYVREAAFENANSDRELFVVGKEAQHVRGIVDADPAASFTNAGQALRAASACLVRFTQAP